jgi:hypothetical protein
VLLSIVAVSQANESKIARIDPISLKTGQQAFTASGNLKLTGLFITKYSTKWQSQNKKTEYSCHLG